MMQKKIVGMLSVVLVVGVLWIVSAWGNSKITPQEQPTPQEQLGKFLFNDTNLSTPRGQSCSACHAGYVGWTGPDEAINALGAVYEGAFAGRFGNRKPPASAY